MDKLIKEYQEFLSGEGKSKNTIESYKIDVKGYFSWYYDSYGIEFRELYRNNILDYKSFLINVKRHKGRNLNGKTVNRKLSSLLSFNKYLVSKELQSYIIIEDQDFVTVQTDYANPCVITKLDVEQFRQAILIDGDKRLYCIATLFAYSGLRIQEALDCKINDFNLETRELIVRKGKGNKQRIVYLNSKIINSIKGYLKVRPEKGEFLFVSRESNNLNRTIINKQFNKYSKVITPHMLRHFYCTNALETGYGLHEIANLAGHRDIKTTLIYTNPSREELKRKSELL